MRAIYPLKTCLLAAIFLTACASGAFTAPDADGTLARLTAKAGQVHSIQSSFTQEKRLDIFNRTLVSKGVFAFERPQSLRWEYLEPVRSGFALHDGEGRRWNELSGESRDFTVRQDPVMQIVSGQILLWTTLDLSTLSRTFRIEVESDSPAILRFTPLAQGAGPIAGMRITFTPDDAAISSIEIHEAEGDSTVIRFHDTRLNGEIAPRVFTQQ